MRRFAILITTLVLTMSGLVLSPTHADTVSCTTGSFTVTGTEVVSTSNTCSGTAIIPEGVTSIGRNAFASRTLLTGISLPSTLTTIDYRAFHGTGITSITIPATVTSIQDYAFGSATSLTTVIFDGTSTLTLIKIGAFHGATALTSITIPAGVTEIQGSAFYGATALTSINIPASVTAIGAMAFYGTTSLTAFNVSSTNVNYASVNGVLLNKAETSLIAYPAGGPDAYSIPASVTSIGREAFDGVTILTSITIPASVVSLGDAAFRNASNLTSLFFFGDEPSYSYEPVNSLSERDNTFYGIASGAQAYIKTGATGFTGTGSTWTGRATTGFYTVSYNTNGGSFYSDQGFVSSVAEPTTPTRTGYTFAGWSATDGGTTPISFPHTPVSASDITLYALWTQDIPESVTATPTQSVTATPTCRPGLAMQVYFASNSTKVSKSSKKKLKKIENLFKASGCSRIKINGYTSQETNKPSTMNKVVRARISLARAKSVEKYVVKSLKVTGVNSVKGFSQKNPIAANKSEQSRKPNRRVEIWFY